MDDRKPIARSKAAVLQAMQRFALEQSVEESVNVNPESENRGPADLRGLRKREPQGKQASAPIVASHWRRPRKGRKLRAPIPSFRTEPPGDHHYHHHYHHHYFSKPVALEWDWRFLPRRGQRRCASGRDLARCGPRCAGRR